MRSEPSHPSAREYVSDLAASGRYHLASRDMQSALGVSAAAKLALNRLAKKKVIASPARCFYVIVPPEYRSLACLPADQLTSALMKHLDLPYYAGLLSGARFHGAAHQQPQEFQVFRKPPASPATKKAGAEWAKLMEQLEQLEQIPTEVSTGGITRQDLTARIGASVHK